MMLSKKEELILRLLGNDEKYGHELVEASEGKLSRGTVYVHLDRLEDRNLVASRLEDPGDVPEGLLQRRKYRATGEGKRALAEAEEDGEGGRIFGWAPVPA